MGDNPWDDFFELAEGVKDLWEEHGDDVKGFIESDNEISLKDSEPLIEANKTDDEVLVEMEVVNADGITDFSFSFIPGSNKMEVDGPNGTTSVILPDDSDPSNADASFNNGVLSLTVPRDSVDIGIVDERDEDGGGEQ